MVPDLADWAVPALVGDRGAPAVLTRHRDGHEDALARWRHLHPALLRPGTTTAGVLLTGEPVLLADASAADLSGTAVGPDGPELARLAAVLGVRSVVVVPLTARRRVLGVLSLVTGPGRRLTGDDLAVATDLARRAGLALDNARLHAAEHDTAVALQRSLLPAVPQVPGIDAAARHLPGDDRAEVGGDRYDVLDLPDRVTGLVIGDVMGHDIAAAAAMGQLRSVLRACAWEGDHPARVLEGGTRMVIGVDAAPTSAGGGAGATRPIRPRSVLLLFTDGLVERRHEDLDVGLADVARRLAAHDPSRGPAALVEDLVGDVRTGGGDDDVCLLAVHVL